MKKTHLIFVALLLFAMPAFAESSLKSPPNYLSLKLGGYFPMANDIDRFDSGFNGEVVYGRSLDPGFAVEGGIGYFETKGHTPEGLAERKFKIMPLTFNIRGTVPFSKFQAYAMAGIGVYFINDEISVPVFGVSNGTSDSAADLGLYLGLGGNYNMTRNVFFGLEGKYLWLNTNTFGVTTHLDGPTVTADIGYRF